MDRHPWRAVCGWAVVACALLVWNYDWAWQGAYYLRNHATRAAFSILVLGAATLYAVESVRRSRFRGYVLRALAGIWAAKRWMLVALVAAVLCLVAFYLPWPRAKGWIGRNAPPPTAKSPGSEWDVISSKPLDTKKEAPTVYDDILKLAPPASGKSKKTSR